MKPWVAFALGLAAAGFIGLLALSGSVELRSPITLDCVRRDEFNRLAQAHNAVADAVSRFHPEIRAKEDPK